ncbi:AAA family ATPase [Oribacterium sp. NK2B42]|uniref:AAA family ATPase n=1 Tax=Oribacterium sp. NK2B42 TaxID=689781 RepID=UPI0004124CA6|nr:AAA family ATPase [Oribacterium sp. NK2B42]
MKLKIKNIGRFHDDTAIDIDGITVLAGVNGIGKSTIGKVLYCLFGSLHNYMKQIDDERSASVYRVLRNAFIHNNTVPGSRHGINRIINHLADLAKDDLGKAALVKNIAGILGKNESELDDEIVNRIIKVLKYSDEEILKAIINKRLEAEFDAQVGHVNYPGEESCISLTINNNTIVIYLNDGELKLENNMELSEDIVYLDDPYVVDDMDKIIYMGDYSHRSNLIEKLTNKDDKRITIIDGLIVNEGLKAIIKKINQICDVSLGQGEEDEYQYKERALKERLSVKNLSTGMKSFAIIKTLLIKGYVEENGVIILDEPEAHLHPEWMIVYAEIIVLLQKELKINFVISTHSSEFLSYLDYYIKKYSVINNCKFYLLEENKKDPTITNIFDYSSNLDKIYDVLTRPFIWVSKELDSQL